MKIPWTKEWQSTPVFLPREFHGLYSPWGCKESDTTEQLSLSHTHTHTYIVCCCLVTQLCLTLCNQMDCSPPSSPVMGLSRQKYWSGLPLPSPGYLPYPRIEPGSPALQEDSLLPEPPGKPILIRTKLLKSQKFQGLD